ncbi:putative cell wall glucanase protein [Zalerion maritima]|uniref:Crh-like protein n=1 Tax=Zalerion maritima TaxID=339359 RepID=A0AAD5WQS5_9PEZI|nr:putative cell wall glucanase protein [Zalerion maritima]
MLSRFLLPVGVALLGANLAVADQESCDLDNKCPEDTPCCSQYGQCGVGAYCLGGCDPRMSFSIESCAPIPVCESRTFSMDSLDGIVDVSEYLGDASKADFVSQGEPIAYNDNVLLTMPPRSVGTVLATTVNIWYGTIKAKLKTSRGAGVVTAFILLSDVKDEIDYEFVGTELETAQTNYYFQGVTDYGNSQNISLSDTFSNWHEYEIRWTPDKITWLVDGQEGRTKKRSETWDDENQRWNYPQTPSRLQISIWPGGADTNKEGTIEWAGGPIDWENHPDMENPGYYYATFGEISIECYDADSAPGTNKGVSYWFDDIAATNDTVVDGDKDTILGSFLATGLDMDKGKSDDDSSDDDDVATIPGGSSSGTGSTSGATSDEDSNSSDSSSSDDSSGGGGGDSSNSGSSGSSDSSSDSSCDTGSFSQDCNGGADSGAAPERVMGASALAGIVALGALLIL